MMTPDDVFVFQAYLQPTFDAVVVLVRHGFLCGDEGNDLFGSGAVGYVDRSATA